MNFLLRLCLAFLIITSQLTFGLGTSDADTDTDTDVSKKRTLLIPEDDYPQDRLKRQKKRNEYVSYAPFWQIFKILPMELQNIIYSYISPATKPHLFTLNKEYNALFTQLRKTSLHGGFTTLIIKKIDYTDLCTTLDKAYDTYPLLKKLSIIKQSSEKVESNELYLPMKGIARFSMLSTLKIQGERIILFDDLPGSEQKWPPINSLTLENFVAKNVSATEQWLENLPLNYVCIRQRHPTTLYFPNLAGFKNDSLEFLSLNDVPKDNMELPNLKALELTNISYLAWSKTIKDFPLLKKLTIPASNLRGVTSIDTEIIAKLEELHLVCRHGPNCSYFDLKSVIQTFNYLWETCPRLNIKVEIAPNIRCKGAY